MQMHNPPHPELVLEDALENTPLTVTEFAEHLGVARVTLSRILKGRADTTAEMSMRISEAFDQSPSL